jgi:hypothetical protein
MRRTLPVFETEQSSSAHQSNPQHDSTDSLARFLGIVFGNCILACHEGSGKLSLQESSLSTLTQRVFQGFSQSFERSERTNCRESHFGDVEVQTTQSRTNIGSDVIDFNDAKANIGKVNDLQTMRSDSMTTTERESYLQSIHQQICELKKSISEIDRETFSLGKWTALNEEPPHPEHKSIHCFLMSRSWPPTGMINYLTKDCGGNVHDRTVVTVTGNSPQHSNLLKQTVELAGDDYYYTENKPDQWICYDFRNMRVTPRGYSIRTNGGAKNGSHLRSWVIEGTSDSGMTSWTEIDRRENNSDLNGVTFHACFPIFKGSDESYRYIRLRMTGPNHTNSHLLYILGFELFGKLYTP